MSRLTFYSHRRTCHPINATESHEAEASNRA